MAAGASVSAALIKNDITTMRICGRTDLTQMGLKREIMSLQAM